jgi:transcriptional regulator with XRE-family HTH domain
VPTGPGTGRASQTPDGGPSLDDVDNRQDIRDFLRSRRARITPEQADMPIYGGNRRVPGLRREEVALLAGVSVDYYTRLERGNLSGVSQTVLESIARALKLDEAERAHLLDLARASGGAPHPRRRPSAAKGVRPGVQRILDAMTGAPAWVRNARMDCLATNSLGRALYCDLLSDPVRPANNARFVFLDPRSQDFFVNWEGAANDIVAMLRSEAGRDPYDRALTDLVGELSTRSETFRTKWAAHNVRFHRSGVKQLHHPVVGRLDLTYEAMQLPADPDLTLLAYTAESGSPSEDGLKLLASWAATLEQVEEPQTTGAAEEG